MNVVDMVREAVQDITKHPVLELNYADHGFDQDGNLTAERQHGTFVFRADFEGSGSLVQVMTVADGSNQVASSGFPVESIPQVVEHLQAIYKEMQQ